MNLAEFGEYKEKIGTKIRALPEIKALLGTGANVDKQVLDMLYIPGIVSDARTYILFDTDVPRVVDFEIKDVRIIIQVISHKSVVNRTNSSELGNRNDLISKYIDMELNGSRDFGIGRLALSNVSIVRTDEGYYGRQLVYMASEFNDRR